MYIISVQLCVTTPNFMVIPHSITELQNFKHITRFWNSTLIPSEVFFALALSCDFMKCSCYVKKNFAYRSYKTNYTCKRRYTRSLAWELFGKEMKTKTLFLTKLTVP